MTFVSPLSSRRSAKPTSPCSRKCLRTRCTVDSWCCRYAGYTRVFIEIQNTSSLGCQLCIRRLCENLRLRLFRKQIRILPSFLYLVDIVFAISRFNEFLLFIYPNKCNINWMHHLVNRSKESAKSWLAKIGRELLGRISVVYQRFGLLSMLAAP